ncbi:MAG: hypothetical protein AAB638_00890 [Patescibacteria group bacterium]
MKKSLLIITLLCLSLFTFAQGRATDDVDTTATVNVPDPTTEAEYNYLTKGYRVQIESGLDMKKGYLMEDSQEITRGNYVFQIKFLMREAANELAAILIITKSNVSGNSYYTCVPINNSELINKYYAALYAWDKALLVEYCLVTSAMFGQMTSALIETTK